MHNLIKTVAVATLLLTAVSSYAEGKYTPCMVKPVFVPATISTPIITPAEIVSPEFAQATRSRWLIERTDIDPPNIVLPVFVQPRYDGCVEQTARRMRMEQIFGTRNTSFAGPLAKPAAISTAAARAFTDASSTSCCGGSAGGR